MKSIYVLIFVVIYLFHFSCFNLFECKNEIIETIESPSKNKKVVIFQRDCGATTNGSTQVSILAPEAELHDGNGGNIFIVEDAKKDVIVEWKNDEELWIYSRNNIETYLKKEKLDGVSIVYKNILAE